MPIKFIVETQEDEHGGWNDWGLPGMEFDTLAEAMAEAERRASVFTPTRVVQVFGEWFDKQS